MPRICSLSYKWAKKIGGKFKSGERSRGFHAGQESFPLLGYSRTFCHFLLKPPFFPFQIKCNMKCLQGETEQSESQLGYVEGAPFSSQVIPEPAPCGTSVPSGGLSGHYRLCSGTRSTGACWTFAATLSGVPELCQLRVGGSEWPACRWWTIEVFLAAACGSVPL